MFLPNQLLVLSDPNVIKIPWEVWPYRKSRFPSRTPIVGHKPDLVVRFFLHAKKLGAHTTSTSTISTIAVQNYLEKNAGAHLASQAILI